MLKLILIAPLILAGAAQAQATQVILPAGGRLAATGVVHITTRNGVKTYPHGFIGCLDPARFGVAAAASFGQGVGLKPADGK